MATKPVKTGVEEEGPAVHRIRITLTSKNVKNLEKGERTVFKAVFAQISQVGSRLFAWKMLEIQPPNVL
jgi:hypothetical protein